MTMSVKDYLPIIIGRKSRKRSMILSIVSRNEPHPFKPKLTIEIDERMVVKEGMNALAANYGNVTSKYAWLLNRRKPLRNKGPHFWTMALRHYKVKVVLDGTA